MRQRIGAIDGIALLGKKLTCFIDGLSSQVMLTENELWSRTRRYRGTLWYQDFLVMKSDKEEPYGLQIMKSITQI